MEEKKLDRRRKYFMILDCETATLPFINEYTAEIKKKIAIAKPLIYDFGYQIIDNKGRVYRKRSYLITEVFSVPSVFNTAYYASKRPIYIERLKKGETTLKSWHEATETFEKDLQTVVAVGAYNSMFDFKKAIPFTEKYIKALYSDNYADFEQKQKYACNKIAQGKEYNNDKNFDALHFIFRGKKYKMFDLWGLSCEHLLNNNEYKNICKANEWFSPSKKYFSTSAEKTFAYVTENHNFSEAHTAIDDAEIESIIFEKIVKKSKNKFAYGIIYFPFRILGKVEEFIE